MRCCTCGSACRRFTTNLRKHEELRYEAESGKTDLDGSGGDRGDGSVHLRRRGDREAVVELAAANAVRMAHDHLLAGAGHSSFVPDSFRTSRFSPWRRASLRAPADPGTHGRALGADDARGARKDAPALARILRRL